MIFPWHEQNWRNITENNAGAHHGLLVAGKSGTGMREFADALSRFLLCEPDAPNLKKPCQRCQNCQLFEAGSHPDFHMLTSEYESVHSRIKLFSAYSDRYLDARERDKKAKPSKVISVNQVRQLIDRFSTHSHISSSRVALIHPADRMNINASNALLKLLEEPPENAKLILLTAEPARLPRTILSRCVNINVANPTAAQSVKWLSEFMAEDQAEVALHLANMAPMHAREIYESGELEARQDFLKVMISTITGKANPLDVAQQSAKMDFESTLLWMQQFVRDVSVWLSAGRPPFWTVPTLLSDKQLSENRLFSLYDRITHYRKIARGSINEQLALEDLFISLTRVSR